MKFSEELRQAVTLLGGPETDHVVDFFLDPRAATLALSAVEEHEGIVVRVFPTAGRPDEPLWARLQRGAPEIGTATRRGQDGAVRRVVRVRLDVRESSCCDASGCHRTLKRVAVVLVIEGLGKGEPEEELEVAEEHTSGAQAAAMTRTAKALAEALCVQLVDGSAEGPDSELDISGGPAAAAAPRDVCRFVVHTEGDRVVFRDLGREGPRASALWKGVVGVAFFAITLGFAYALAGVVQASATIGQVAAYAALTALMGLVGYTFWSMGFFASKYTAKSEVFAAVLGNRLVVQPWVNRDGLVMDRAEGRYGAAIPLSEVSEVVATPRGSGTAVEVRTSHGPIDAIVCDAAASAEVLVAALRRVIGEMQHPRLDLKAKRAA